MFNLWNTVAGNPSSSTASPISRKEKKEFSTRIKHTGSSINEDRAAEELLSRFPEYGSSRNRNNDEFYDDDIDYEDDEEESKENDGNSSSNEFFQYGNKSGTLPQSNSENWDTDEKELWKVDENNKLHPQHLNFSFTRNTSSSEKQSISVKKKTPQENHGEELQQSNHGIKTGSPSFDKNNQKQHWMPDSLCKQCYACETQFTVFRRRHHCRLCGRVFCSNCSAFFVELAPENIPQSSTALNTGEKRNQTNDKRHQNKVGGKVISLQHQLPYQKEHKRTMRSCKICYDQVYSSPSHAALYGLGKNEAAGRWEHHEGSNGDELQLHSLRRITSQPNIAVLKNTTEFSENKKAERAPKLSSIKDTAWSVQTPSPSNGRLLQSKKKTNYDTKLSTDRNVTNTQKAQEKNTIGISFVNKDQDSYDESSFQALNSTKQKLQERAAAALKAVADANGEQPPDLNLLLQQHELHQQGDNTSNDIKMHQRNNIIDGEHDALNINNQKALVDQSNSLNETTDKRLPLTRIISSFVDRKNKEVDVSKQRIGTEQDQINSKISIKEDNDQNTTAKNLEHSFTTSNIDVGSQINSSQKNASDKAHPQSQNQRIGELAAMHLEKMTRELLISDAPLLLQEFPNGKWKKWINTILMLVTRACATVMPNVKMGDLLDIRPYCKVKVIAGGLSSDSAYVSGIVFHKNVSHKQMAKEIINPRIMLLSGGIEFTRTSNQIASLETLLEQEEKYMEIVVMKIIGLKPSVLMVGKSVTRRAQELLLDANIVLIQKVKSDLMSRIARQTGATILSSMDHVMTQFEISILGRCRRFRLVTFRDEEAWREQCSQFQRIARSRIPSKSYHGSKPLPMPVVLQSLPNCHRQAVLAATRIGQNVMDGSEAVKCGLAKRGIARTYIMLEGCPKQLGCTVILRGASRATLKQIKRVLSFLFTVGYNLTLETSYLKERRVCLPVNYKERDDTLASSSSLCVHYGKHPFGRKTRPWNGGNVSKGKVDLTRSLSGKVTAFDHQSILITSVWMTDKVQCCPAEVKGICYYSLQDVSLGQFLRDSCFNLNLKCQNSSCKKSVMEHSLSFIHNDGLINITVEQMDDPLPSTTNKNSSSRDNGRAQNNSSKEKDTTTSSNETDHAPIATWTYCTHCRKVVTPLVFLSDKTWQLSFGKFVEIYFYNKDFVLQSTDHSCSCQMQSKAILYFGCGRLAARFTYERIEPYSVYVWKSLPFNHEFHLQDALVHLEKISNASSYLFSRFDKHIERVSREIRQLFASSVNKADFLQTLLGEVNSIGSEVDHAAKTVHEKIATVTMSCTESNNYGTIDNRGGESPLLRFPWHARRYLALLCSVWNERLSAVGQALTAMKKFAAAVQLKASSGRGELAVVGMNAAANAIVGESYGTTSDDVMEAMKKVRKIKESYSQYNVRDLDIRSYSDRINMASRSYENNHDHYDAKHERKSNQRASRSNRSDYDMHDYEEDVQDDLENDMLELNSNEFESLILEDGPDFDAMLSRQRQKSNDRVTVPLRPTKSLGTRRPLDMNKSSSRSLQSNGRMSRQSSITTPSSPSQTFKPYDHPLVSPPPETSKSKTVTPGGAVKSVITRFFNRGYKEMDPYVVDLGIFSEGSPHLEPGIRGMIIPVYENQPSTIIAHSLNSEEYHKQFRKYSNLEKDVKGSDESTSNISERTFEDKNNDPLISTNRARTNKSVPLSQRDERKDIERRMLVESKAHIKDTFKELDLKGQQICKYICTTFWATQFHAVRQAFLSSSKNDSQSDEKIDVEQTYIQSLSASNSWAASGGKSGASFSLTKDGRFVVKCISRTELQMFLDCASAYFEYLSKAFFHGLPTVLCKILGVYQIGYTNRVTGKRSMEQVAVMQNIFYDRKISVTFDLKGTQRGRFAKLLDKDKKKSKADSMNEENVSDRDADANKTSSKKKYTRKGSKNDYDESSSDSSNQSDDSEDDSPLEESSDGISSNDSKATNEKVHGNGSANKNAGPTLLDGDFLEFTGGRPLPLNDRAKALFHMSILNDTLFLSLINVLDYSILVGIDDEKKELVVGIIDFMRQYDILKQMERVGKSIPMVVGASLPTIIQPPLYKARFTNAMERYFMTVPNKWTTI